MLRTMTETGNMPCLYGTHAFPAGFPVRPSRIGSFVSVHGLAVKESEATLSITTMISRFGLPSVHLKESRYLSPDLTIQFAGGHQKV